MNRPAERPCRRRQAAAWPRREGRRPPPQPPPPPLMPIALTQTHGIPSPAPGEPPAPPAPPRPAPKSCVLRELAVVILMRVTPQSGPRSCSVSMGCPAPHRRPPPSPGSAPAAPPRPRPRPTRLPPPPQVPYSGHAIKVWRPGCDGARGRPGRCGAGPSAPVSGPQIMVLPIIIMSVCVVSGVV